MTETPPTVRERTASDLLDQRVLLLDGELDDSLGTQLCAQLVLLSVADPESDIALWINSPGGSVPAMLAIRDTMEMIPNDVATLGLGMAASAGQFLLAAGTRGKRYVLPHGKVLLHQGSAGIGGSAVDIELQAEDLRAMRDTVLQLTAEQTGKTPEQIFTDSLRDHWYSAEEAREYGFVDHVVTSFDQVRPRRRGVPRSGFASTGQEQA
ncbi:ATP-dependent Clp protease proteolytic subunit [Auraticoccus sp. F435]|uniref:ATP-dependent Clp protease proteolytic subunit n=1 Tax=Auraticoccus cholistanensis TaxID=2656650 RepID=A0A6A9UP86_9ACTN|nr:ATP-dependent Clp protease proteolytic subunit [Auraticoccus cholistanensis]MVA74686.1 ATP-dependent Clp protease proteolytic subunit [Auraticoccus cholistanensis]